MQTHRHPVAVPCLCFQLRGECLVVSSVALTIVETAHRPCAIARQIVEYHLDRVCIQIVPAIKAPCRRSSALEEKRDVYFRYRHTTGICIEIPRTRRYHRRKRQSKGCRAQLHSHNCLKAGTKAEIRTCIGEQGLGRAYDDSMSGEGGDGGRGSATGFRSFPS
jgi:hypothetical protein